MIWLLSFPPARPDHNGRMRHFAARCLVATHNLLELVCRKGESEVRHALAGVRTLPYAVTQVGRSRGAARALVLRAQICRQRLDELRHWCCRAASRARGEAVAALDWLLCEVRAWSRVAREQLERRAAL